MLDVRRLRVLREVAHRGTVRAAAEALHLTGPAVSQQLAALERESATTLVERDGRSIRLTPAAHLLVAHADAVIAQLEAAEADLAAAEGRYGGELRVASFPSALAVLAPVLAELAAAMPQVRLTVTELEPEASLAALRVRELDLAVAHEYDRVPRRVDPAFHTTELRSEPLLVALPAEHPRAAGPLALADLAEEPGWVVPPGGLTCFEEVRRLCAAAGFDPHVRARTYTYESTLAFVAAGAVALVPESALRAAPPGVVAVAPTDVAGRRRTFAAVRRGDAHRPSVALALERLRAAAIDAAPGRICSPRDG